MLPNFYMSYDNHIINRIFQKLDELHEEVHDLSKDITEIKQWKKDQDDFADECFNKKIARRDKLFGIIGSAAAISAVIVVFFV